MNICIRATDTKRQVEVYTAETFHVSRKFVTNNMIPVYNFYVSTPRTPLTTKPGKHFHEFSIHGYSVPLFLFTGSFTAEEAEGLSYNNMAYAITPTLTSTLIQKVDEINNETDVLDIKNLVSVISKVLSHVSRKRIEKLFKDYKEEEETNEQKTLQHTKKFKQIYDVFLSELKKI